MSEVITEGTFFNGVIADIAEINPRTDIALAEEERVSFLPMQNTSESGDIIALQERVFAQVSKGYTRFAENDVLVAKITPCFENGKGGYAKGLLNGIGFGSTEFHIVRAIPGKADSRFLHHLTRSERFRKAGEGSMTGSAGQKRIPSNFIKDFPIFIPPLPEQKKIAEILSGIDEEIHTIKNLISLLTLTKRNLLQDTAEKGQNNFSVKALGEIASVINGYAFSSGDLEDASDGIPVIRMSNLKSGAVQYESALKIQENKASELERFLLRKGDLLIGMSGSISNAALVTSDRKALLNQRVGALRAKNEGSSYHAIAYQSEIVMRQVEQMAAGGAQLNISSSQIESVEIPIPSQSNMEKITQCWFSIENTIRLNQTKLGKMCSLKSAMSSDLLSGRKRVSI